VGDQLTALRAVRRLAEGKLRRRATEVGMATAEYAVVTLAACGFAGLLVAILHSDTVRGLLLGIIRRALAG
jgi:Protein of unknown function (DUF4244)